MCPRLTKQLALFRVSIVTGLYQISGHHGLFSLGQWRDSMQSFFLLGLGIYFLKYILNIFNVFARCHNCLR